MDEVRADGEFMDKKRSDACVRELDVFASEMRVAAVEHHFGANESTIRFITKNEGKIRGSVKSGVPSSVKVSRMSRHDLFLEKTERVLCMTGR